jgi:signal transduction histidine kinase
VSELFFHHDLVWPAVAFVGCLLVIGTLLWRRTHPLAAVLVGFGSFGLLDVASIVSGTGEVVGLYTSACALLLPYALFRWASGRDAAVGLAVIVAVGALGTALDYTSIGATIGGAIVLMLPVVLGAAVRFRTQYRHRTREQVQLRERERLARELHDTVAHHVSAIAVRAQAGQVVSRTRPEAALEALQVIEEEASRALKEMRAVVGVLRDGQRAELAPQPGVADVRRLARDDDRPRVEVVLSGDLDGLGPAVDAAVYRIAQESVTNALRHSRDASRVLVDVCGDAESVRLTVQDDGAPAGQHEPVGFGLVGMTERAALLGGTLAAGPAAGRGWTVTAVLPRDGVPT